MPHGFNDYLRSSGFGAAWIDVCNRSTPLLAASRLPHSAGGYPRCEGAYLLEHSSGAVLGRAFSLSGARLLIDEQIQLLRQRLAAAA